MKWPYVSRTTLDIVIEERDRLRKQVDDLVDHVRRMDRAEHGLHEVPHDKRPTPEPPPKSLTEYIKGFQFKGMRDIQWHEVKRRRRAGESWESIEAEIRQGRSDQDVTPAEGT